jgi:hypothetical protein
MEKSRQLDVHSSCTPAAEVRYETGSEWAVAERVVDAVAEAKGVGITELPPLYDAIDPDALTQLVERQDGTAGGDTVVSFTFGRWNVFVRADGWIRVCDSTRRADPRPVFADG